MYWGRSPGSLDRGRGPARRRIAPLRERRPGRGREPRPPRTPGARGSTWTPVRLPGHLPGRLNAQAGQDRWILRVAADGLAPRLRPRRRRRPRPGGPAYAPRSSWAKKSPRLLVDGRSRLFARGTIYSEKRDNGTPLQRNESEIKRLAFGFDQPGAAGAFSARATSPTSSSTRPSRRWPPTAHGIAVPRPARPLRRLAASRPTLRAFGGAPSRSASSGRGRATNMRPCSARRHARSDHRPGTQTTSAYSPTSPRHRRRGR